MTLLLAISMLAGIQTGNASRYGYAGDIYDRVGSFACRRTLSARYGDRVWQQMRSQGLAHRTLPCGTRLGVCNVRTGQCTVAYVVDRGPWGVLDRKGEWHVRTGRLLPGEHYRGELDLLPGTYSAINVVGIERVAFWPLPLPDAQSMRRGIKLPPLRAMGPSSVACDISPLHREQPFPPLRDGLPSQVTYTLAGPAVAPPVLTAAEPETAPVELAVALPRTEPALPAPQPGRAVLLPLRLYETPRSRHSARRPFPPLRT